MLGPVLTDRVHHDREEECALGNLFTDLMRAARVPFALLHCTSMYPTPYDYVRLGALGELAQAGWDWVVEQIPTWYAKLLEWGTQLIEWIGPQTEPMLGKLGELLGSLTGWIVTDAIPAVIEKCGAIRTHGSRMPSTISPGSRSTAARVVAGAKS